MSLLHYFVNRICSYYLLRSDMVKEEKEMVGLISNEDAWNKETKFRPI